MKHWIASALALSALCGCYAGEPFKIQDRRLVDLENYSHEWSYVAKRRESAGLAGDPVESSNLVGLALSGGGIRSAAMSYGILQGLHQTNILPTIDSLSAVSGGAYVGSWFV